MKHRIILCLFLLSFGFIDAHVSPQNVYEANSQFNARKDSVIKRWFNKDITISAHWRVGGHIERVDEDPPHMRWHEYWVIDSTWIPTSKFGNWEDSGQNWSIRKIAAVLAGVKTGFIPESELIDSGISFPKQVQDWLWSHAYEYKRAGTDELPPV